MARFRRRMGAWTRDRVRCAQGSAPAGSAERSSRAKQRVASRPGSSSKTPETNFGASAELGRSGHRLDSRRALGAQSGWTLHRRVTTTARRACLTPPRAIVPLTGARHVGPVPPSTRQGADAFPASPKGRHRGATHRPIEATLRTTSRPGPVRGPPAAEVRWRRDRDLRSPAQPRYRRPAIRSSFPPERTGERRKVRRRRGRSRRWQPGQERVRARGSAAVANVRAHRARVLR